jgi:hypothetical protein
MVGNLLSPKTQLMTVFLKSGYRWKCAAGWRLSASGERFEGEGPTNIDQSGNKSTQYSA